MVITELFLLAYFFYVVTYTLTFAVSAYRYKIQSLSVSHNFSRFAVLIPSYKEDRVIIDVARHALEQRYPTANFHVFIVADSLQPDTVQRLRRLPVTVVEVIFESSTKVKALNHVLAQIPGDTYDYAVVLDADNVMEPDFLSKMNSIMTQYGHKAVQAQRKPKNKENNLAFLDGVSEAINNHIYRQGAAAIGASSSISGSGIAFDFQLLKMKLKEMNSVGGYDRELELKLLDDGVQVYYLKQAVIYDEKVTNARVFRNQRKRWIFSQYYYLAKYFRKGCSELFRGNFTYFNSAVLRNIQLPRLINLGLLTLITIVSISFHDRLLFGSEIWIALFLLNAFSILISIPREFYSGKMIRAILDLPLVFMHLFLVLFKLKNANRKFLHTEHSIVTRE